MICLECKKKHNNPKFCSRACSILFNNRKRASKATKRLCLHCGKLTKNFKFCSHKCNKVFTYRQNVQMWLAGTHSGLRGIKVKLLSNFVRRWIKESQQYHCALCNRITWRGQPITLEIDHIDGDWENNRPENLRALCPNCHSQTDTYKAKNKKGRPWR